MRFENYLKEAVDIKLIKDIAKSFNYNISDKEAKKAHKDVLKSYPKVKKEPQEYVDKIKEYFN